MPNFNWNCPHCEHAVTISDGRYSSLSHTLDIDNSVGRRTVVTEFIVCPNTECQKFTLRCTLFLSRPTIHDEDQLLSSLNVWALIPSSAAKQFPDYVPKQIREDYREACLIKDLSPKASATLSRRCLQGILRDFWEVKPGRLIDEIDQIKSKVDLETWDAINSLRKLGNIGAHMEQDIDVIVDVDPNEAGLLIGLVETVIREWYVSREDRRVRMAAITAAANAKKPSPSQASPSLT